MADENNLGEEEYQFSEVETGEAVGTETKTKAASSPAQVKKRIMLAIGVIVVVLSVYKLLGFFFASQAKKAKPVQ